MPQIYFVVRVHDNTIIYFSMDRQCKRNQNRIEIFIHRFNRMGKKIGSDFSRICSSASKQFARNQIMYLAKEAEDLMSFQISIIDGKSGC